MRDLKVPWKSLRRVAVGGPGFSAAWRALGRSGLFRLPPRRALPALETLGRELGFGGMALAVGAQMWAVQEPLRRFGTAAQKRLLARLASGAVLGAPAITEEAAGSDILSMGAQARPVGGGYLLDARKTFVTGAEAAGLFLVWARLAGRTGPLSLSCFIVERGQRGVSTRARRWSMGPQGSGMGTLTLASVRVGAARRLGPEGGGLKVFSHAMASERRMILAPAVGAMEARLRETAAYAAARRQFGRPLTSFQAVAHRLADMRIRWEACRALQAAAAARPGDEALPSVVKAFVSESWVANCLDAAQLQGAQGLAGGDSLRDELGAALSSRLLSGSNEIQRNMIAKLV